MLVNYGRESSLSITDAYERDFFLLKKVIKAHNNIIECVMEQYH